MKRLPSIFRKLLIDFGVFASICGCAFTASCNYRLTVKCILFIVPIFYVQIPLRHVTTVEPNQTLRQKIGTKVILFCGEALIEMFPWSMRQPLIQRAGGVVFNTALGIGR